MSDPKRTVTILALDTPHGCSLEAFALATQAGDSLDRYIRLRGCDPEEVRDNPAEAPGWDPRISWQIQTVTLQGVQA